MPSLKKLGQKYGDREFTILMINIGEREEVIAAFVERAGLPFPIAMDHDGEVARLYQVYGIPAAFLVDRQGRILFGSRGYHDWESEKLHRLLDTLLTEDEPTSAAAKFPAATATGAWGPSLPVGYLEK